MSKRYGLPYKGSKSRIAEWVVSALPESHTLVDLFAGGCAVTHCALLSGKWETIVVNDLSDAPQVFVDACLGEFEGYCTVPTREEFFAGNTEDETIALLYSFGNGKDTYLWSKDIEQIKVHASRMLSAPSMHERRMEYRKFVKALSKWLASGHELGETLHLQGVEATERAQMIGHLDRISSIEGVERSERLQGIDGLIEAGRLKIHRKDYRCVRVPIGATVYADPPYRGTDMRGYGDGFDFGAFDEWLAEVPFPVFVSEYTCPAGCVEIAHVRHASRMCAKGPVDREERLFVQERFAEEARRQSEAQSTRQEELF